MGGDLAGAFATAREVFGEVDEALKQNLSKLMQEGPESDLILTENAQPALMAVSVAVARILEKDGGKPLSSLAAYVAGHSLGEYSALAAAGALRLTDAARLLKLRGQSMQKAVPVGVGAMAALLGIELEPAQEACKEAAQGEIVAVANDNGGGQVVISGTLDALARAGEIAKARGIKRAFSLPVSAPFHCPLMQPAADRMAEALAAVTIRPLTVSVLANVTASQANDPETVRRLLVEQVTGRVRWRESIASLKGLGVDTTVEFGNKVLTGMVKRIDNDLATIALETTADLEVFGKAL